MVLVEPDLSQAGGWGGISSGITLPPVRLLLARPWEPQLKAAGLRDHLAVSTHGSPLRGEVVEPAQPRPGGADGGRAALAVFSPLPTDSAGNGLRRRPRALSALERHRGCTCLCHVCVYGDR